MTEAEFYSCNDPRAILQWVDRKGHASTQKLRRLFAACCSRIPDGTSPNSERGDRYAYTEAPTHFAWQDYAGAPIALEGDYARFCMFHAAGEAMHLARGKSSEKANLLRCLFGPLSFRPVTISPRWSTSTVIGLARTMDDKGDLTDLPILADALEDAGCNSADIVNHCRSGGPHVKGCWVVDLILGNS
jgi:hypothetical protein